ncbi:MAG: aerolysin family beta-barrel pore-forming toxin [Gammaproteobacteria bacterium]|nr:aerolysin family beta-barrel pore-forming toxin [Gammaproteobacteria bacterium]
MKKFIPLLLLGQPIFAEANTPVLYVEQLQLQSIGAEQCSTKFRPINRLEAQVYKKQILAKMGKWQITSLANGWVLMGSGYYGEIKRDKPASNAWCYPTQPNDEIPELATLYVEAGTKDQIEWNLLNNQQAFITPISNLVHQMGFSWVGGNRGKYVGEAMDITRISDSKWQMIGNNDGSCSGYRCDEKTAITLSNFEYVMDTNSFKITDDIESTKKDLIQTVVVPVINNTSLEQKYAIDLSYDKQINWSKSDTYGISESVTLTNTWKSPSVTGGIDTGLSVTIGANQSWSSTNGGVESKKITLHATPRVPAYSSLNAKIDLYRSSISYPYEFDATISYDIAMKGFMRWSGNGLLTHPSDRPTFEANLVIGRWQGKDTNIQYQWEHRYIPGVNKLWDWPWMIKNTGLNNMKYWLAHVLRPKKTTLSGHFYAESQFAGSVYYGDERPLASALASSSNRQRRSAHSTSAPSASESLKQQLEDAGLKNVTVKIRLIK